MSNLAYWYCPHCKEEIDPTNATFQELHDTCGHAVEWIEGIDLDRLRELCAAERDGRCVVLPCKVGDTVFTIELDCKDNPDHSQMCFCWNKSCKECDKSYLRVWENRNKTADVRSIVSEMGLCGEKGGFGKTVFLTRAEAEAAMKGDSHA